MLKLIEDWLKKLGEQNKKSFGTSKLDCCDLNRTIKTDKIDKNKRNRNEGKRFGEES